MSRRPRMLDRCKEAGPDNSRQVGMMMVACHGWLFEAGVLTNHTNPPPTFPPQNLTGGKLSLQ
eukprot:1286424-Rhodomonas_salina.3